jgi:hypothetical protein
MAEGVEARAGERGVRLKREEAGDRLARFRRAAVMGKRCREIPIGGGDLRILAERPLCPHRRLGVLLMGCSSV